MTKKTEKIKDDISFKEPTPENFKGKDEVLLQWLKDEEAARGFPEQNNKLQLALTDKIWQNHQIGDEYQMDDKKEKWKISYYPIFEDGKTGDKYDEPRALIERSGIFNGIKGTDFREVPLRYLTKCENNF